MRGRPRPRPLAKRVAPGLVVGDSGLVKAVVVAAVAAVSVAVVAPIAAVALPVAVAVPLVVAPVLAVLVVERVVVVVGPFVAAAFVVVPIAADADVVRSVVVDVQLAVGPHNMPDFERQRHTAAARRGSQASWCWNCWSIRWYESPAPRAGPSWEPKVAMPAAKRGLVALLLPPPDAAVVEPQKSFATALVNLRPRAIAV